MMRLMMRRTIVVVLAAAVVWESAAFASDQRLFYEIKVTAPGTRSQGWHGSLFDREGHELAVEAGQTVHTNAGDFVSVACTQPWIPCGLIHADQMRWMNRNGGNFVMDRGPWRYRLYVTAQCTRSEGWRGELLHDGRGAGTRVKIRRTPMGTFVRTASSHLWGRKGWFHISWPASVIAPDHWPCGSTN